jgi:uncharacterized protein involved in outer membrane biogenesis
MKWLKGAAALLVIVVAIAVVVPFFVTLNDYIPALEKEISARIGEPVSIDNLHAAILPVPQARVDGITIGSAEEIQVGKLTLKPDLWSLLRSDKVIRSVELEDVTLTQKALGGLTALSQGDRGAGEFRVERVRLTNALVKFESSQFGPFDVDVQVSSPTQQGLVTLKTRDGALEAHARPEAEHFQVDITARKWTPPIGPAFVFDELEVKGIAKSKSADLTTVRASLYGGTASGAVTIGWEKGVSVKGGLELKHIELQQPVALLSPKTRLSGKLDAKPVFSSHAATTDQLDDALRIESAFTVHDGVLHGFDLITAAATLGKQTRGGQTRFDALAGRLVTEKRTYRFSDLTVASGALAARGSVNIAPSKALSGQLATSANAFGRTLAIPLTVGGTLDAPMLLPTATALAGAAAGTVVLGPGVGTAAGAKLGGIVEGLLGNSRKR